MDFSGVKIIFDDLRQAGVTDLETYLAQHPEAFTQLGKFIRVVDVNRAGVAMHGAANKEHLLANLPRIYSPDPFSKTVRRELMTLWNEETEIIVDAAIPTFTNETRIADVSLAVCPGYEETLARVFASVVDITERK